jgi:hypothetical protein
MSVEVKRVFIMGTNFKPAALTSGDEMIKKRRFSPLVACVSLDGWCETDVGSIQLPT